MNNLFAFSLIALFLLFHSNCVENSVLKDQKGLRIYNGNEVHNIAAFPFTAQYLLNDTFECGAVIISEKKLVTCAHCLPADDEMEFTTQKIRAGSLDPRGGDDAGEIRKVSRYIIHPRHDQPSDHNNDIAILFLDEPLDLTTEKMQKINIAEDDSIYTNANNTFMLTGYGSTESTNDVVNLRWLQEPPVDQAFCTEVYAKLVDPVKITKKMFCAGNEQLKFVREGDSGGPVTFYNVATKKTVLAGLISFNEKVTNDRETFPDVHVNISKFKKWIDKNVKKTENGKEITEKENKKDVAKKLPVLKRVELNQLLDNLLKLGFKSTTSLTEQWNEYIEMKTLISRIQVIETELKVKNTGTKNRMTCIESFLEWAKTNGAEFDGVEIAEFANYELGLVAEKDLKKDEIFMKIPRKMIMSLDNVNASIAPIMSLPMIESMSNVKLAFWLIVEKLNPDSFWKPYLDILPDKYSTVMNFSVADMQELKGSSALAAALNQCKNIARQYAFINKFVKNNQEDSPDSNFEILRERFTYDLYCWAVSTVMTRQNSIPRTSPDNNEEIEAQPTPALIPLWDMANHTDGVVTSSFNRELEQIESAALMDFNKGEQIFIYYGARNNTNLLVHNGFVYPNNSTDSVSIRLGLSDPDPLLSKRTHLLDALKIAKNCELDVMPTPKYISPKLLGFARVFNMNEEQLDHWLTSDRSNDLLHLDCALETALESKIWNFLKMRLTILLKSFPTTLVEDEAIMDVHRKGQNKLGHNKALVIQFRITEKKILRDAFEYVEQRTKA